IDIIMINGIEKSKRGMLLLSERDEHIERLKTVLDKVDTIKVTKIRKSKLRDRLAVRHGKYLQRDAENRKKIRFVRDYLGILINLLSVFYICDVNRIKNKKYKKNEKIDIKRSTSS